MNGILRESFGYSRVITAIDGMEALTVTRESRPDVILLDMMLPKLDGPSVLQALKADATTAHISGRGGNRPVAKKMKRDC